MEELSTLFKFWGLMQTAPMRATLKQSIKNLEFTFIGTKYRNFIAKVLEMIIPLHPPEKQRDLEWYALSMRSNNKVPKSAREEIRAILQQLLDPYFFKGINLQSEFNRDETFYALTSVCVSDILAETLRASDAHSWSVGGKYISVQGEKSWDEFKVSFAKAWRCDDFKCDIVLDLICYGQSECPELILD